MTLTRLGNRKVMSGGNAKVLIIDEGYAFREHTRDGRGGVALKAR